MKRFIFSVILAMAAISMVSAQTTQKGYVKTKGRLDSKGQLIPGQRIASAAIQLTGGHSTVSDANGNFTLTAPDKKFFLSDVRISSACAGELPLSTITEPFSPLT